MASSHTVAAVAVDAKKASPPSNACLARLPPEVLLRITWHLSTKDLGSMRLTCRAIERNLFHSFSHEFFRKKQFMVYSESLQALFDISKHPILSQVLKHVIIGTDRLVAPIAHGWSSRVQELTQNEVRRLHQALGDQMHLVSTGALKEILVEVFSNLSNLETVEIRDFESPSRRRDGSSAKWTSFFAKTLQEQIGRKVLLTRDPSEELDPYPSQLFTTVIAALATSNARPNSLEVGLRFCRRQWGLQDAAFFVSPRIESSATPMLAGLKKLHLTLVFPDDYRMKPLLLQKFLLYVPNITWLRLNFVGHGRSAWTRIEEFLVWLGETSDDEQALGSSPTPDLVRFPYLEQLDFGTISVKAGILLKLLSKFSSTMRTLSLRRVGLMTESSEEWDRGVHPWAGFLKELLKVVGPRFQSLNISYPAWNLSSISSRLLVFRSADQNLEKLEQHILANDHMSLEKAVQEAIDSLHLKKCMYIFSYERESFN